MKRFALRETVVGLSLLASLPALAAGVHQHGLPEAAVVVEGESLTVSFRAPLMDILGTEQPPADAAARVRYEDRLKQVSEPLPSEAAECRLNHATRSTVASLFPDVDAHDHDHDHDHDSSGFMSMVEVTKDLPRSADGLAMDWLEVPFGPCFPGLPGGLKLTLTLDGDGVTEGQATSLVAMNTSSEEVAVETFIERLAAAMPLAPVSYRLLACRAIEQAAGLEPDPAVERGRAAALERERIASHLGWLAQLGRQLSFVWLTRRAAALQLETQRADREQLVALRPALQSLIARLEHTPLLKARLKGIGALPHGSQDLRGTVARASGRTEDARQADAMYRELGFEMRAESAGDAWARLRQRHVEIMTSLDLVEVAGDPELPKLRAIDNPSGTGEATVETPRGRATLRLTQERGQVVSVELDSACSQHIGLVADLVEGQELGDALVAVGSLDLSPWEVTS